VTLQTHLVNVLTVIPRGGAEPTYYTCGSHHLSSFHEKKVDLNLRSSFRIQIRGSSCFSNCTPRQRPRQICSFIRSCAGQLQLLPGQTTCHMTWCIAAMHCITRYRLRQLLNLVYEYMHMSGKSRSALFYGDALEFGDVA
jgi:hypothetical protein